LKLEPLTPDCRVVVKLLVALLKTMAPVLELAVPRVRALVPWIATAPGKTADVADRVSPLTVLEATMLPEPEVKVSMPLPAVETVRLSPLPAVTVPLAPLKVKLVPDKVLPDCVPPERVPAETLPPDNMPPEIVAPSTVVAPVKAPDRAKPTKVGLAPLLMFWIVLTTPDAALKLVALKVAIPLVAPSAAALAMVMAEPDPVELLMVKVPDRPSSEVTPPEPPLPPLRQLAKLKAPVTPSVVRH